MNNLPNGLDSALSRRKVLPSAKEGTLPRAVIKSAVAIVAKRRRITIKDLNERIARLENKAIAWRVLSIIFGTYFVVSVVLFSIIV